MTAPASELARLVCAAACALAALSCAKTNEEVEAPTQKMTARDEILRIGKVWQSQEEEHGARTPPSKVSVFEAKRQSTLTLGADAGEEHFEISEHFELRNGMRFECKSEATLRLRLRYGRRAGIPAVEVTRPPAVIPRKCQPAGYPEPEITLSGGTSRYRLQDEQLVGFAPVSEKRVYLPTE